MQIMKVPVRKLGFKDVFKQFAFALFISLLWINIKKFFGGSSTMLDFISLLLICTWSGVTSAAGFSFSKYPVPTMVIVFVPFFVMNAILVYFFE